MARARRALGWLGCAASLLAAAPAAAQPAEELVLPLAVAGNWKGRLGLPDCHAATPLPTAPELARLAGALDALRVEAAARDELEPLVLHTGDTLFPSGVADYLLSEPDGFGRLQRLLAPFGFDGLAVGGLDLSVPHGLAAPFFAAGQAAGVPWLGSNLQCAGGEPVCAAMRQDGRAFRIVRRGPVRVALLGLITPSHAGGISTRNLQGVTLAEYASAVAPLVASIRKDDLADLVVLVAHTAEFTEELALLQQLGGVDGVDLLVTRFRADGPWKGMAEAGGPLPSLTTPGGTLVLSGARNDRELATARLGLRREGTRWRLKLLDGAQAGVGDATPQPALLDRLGQEAGAFCAAWGQPIVPGLRFDPPLTPETFLGWALDTLRAETHAEVAAVNRGALRNSGILPIAEGLSRADLHTLLPFGGQIATGRLDAEALKGLQGAIGGKAAVAGLDAEGAINGRESDPARRYRVVTLKFLADGGDGLIDPKAWKRRRPLLDDDGTPVDLVDLLVDSLQRRRFARRRDGVIPTDGMLVDLHLKPLFQLGGSANFSYQKTRVEGPTRGGVPVYTASELSTVSSDDIYLDAAAWLYADTKEHRFAFDFTMSYATSKVPSVSPRFFEISDALRGRFTWEFGGLRALVGNSGWMPLPFAEANLLSEIDPPEGRDWHLLRLQAMTGIKLRPWQPLSFKIGPNIRAELLEPGARPTAGLALGYELTRFTVVKLLQRPLELQSATDWLYNDIRRTDIHEIRHATALYYSILDVVSLSATFTAYAYRDRPTAAWGSNLGLLLGVNVRAVAHAQAF